MSMEIYNHLSALYPNQSTPHNKVSPIVIPFSLLPFRANPILSLRAYPILSLRAEGAAILVGSRDEIATAAELPRKDSMRRGDCFGAHAPRNDSRASAPRNDSRVGRVSMIMWTSRVSGHTDCYWVQLVNDK